MATTIHAGDCTSDCAVCVMQCECEKCANVFCCGACGEIVSHADGEQLNNNGFIEFVHRADLCSANDEIGLLCNMCGDEITDEEAHSFFQPLGEICEECTKENN